MFRSLDDSEIINELRENEKMQFYKEACEHYQLAIKFMRNKKYQHAAKEEGVAGELLRSIIMGVQLLRLKISQFWNAIMVITTSCNKQKIVWMGLASC